MSAEAVALPRAARRRPGLGAVYRWEIRKLLVQKRTYLGLFAALAVPLIFIAGLLLGGHDSGPNDIPFGGYVRQSGLAIPLVSMFFGSIWLLPLITSLVSGDIIATEDHNGTLKTILTRSVERWQVFVGKTLAALTYTFAALLIFLIVGLVVGGLIYGFNPLISLSGTHVSVGRGLVLIGAGGIAYFLPIIAIACIGLLLSTLTHNSAAAVVGTLVLSIMLQLLGIISALDFTHPYLLSTQFNAWQGFLRDPIDWAPIVRGAWVSAAYAVPAFAVAFTYFVRRDVAGG
ncbi:MAG TPA: ABC transporter permease [Solirubrobacteraceae bacterium]